MSKRNPKEPVKASNVFQCVTCADHPKFDGVEAFKHHAVSVHGLTEFKGTKRMMAHIDCADSYHSTYEWKVGSIKFMQFTTNPRHKNDMMRHV